MSEIVLPFFLWNWYSFMLPRTLLNWWESFLSLSMATTILITSGLFVLCRLDGIQLQSHLVLVPFFNGRNGISFKSLLWQLVYVQDFHIYYFVIIYILLRIALTFLESRNTCLRISSSINCAFKKIYIMYSFVLL